MEAAEYLDTLKKCVRGSNVEQELLEIEESLDHYDFEHALHVLETIAQRLEIP